MRTALPRPDCPTSLTRSPPPPSSLAEHPKPNNNVRLHLSPRHSSPTSPHHHYAPSPLFLYNSSFSPYRSLYRSFHPTDHHHSFPPLYSSTTTTTTTTPASSPYYYILHSHIPHHSSCSLQSLRTQISHRSTRPRRKSSTPSSIQHPHQSPTSPSP